MGKTISNLQGHNLGYLLLFLLNSVLSGKKRQSLQYPAGVSGGLPVSRNIQMDRSM